MLQNSVGVGVAVGSLFRREWALKNKRMVAANEAPPRLRDPPGADRGRTRLRGFLEGERRRVVQGGVPTFAL